VLAGAKHTKPITAIQVYVDSAKVYQGTGDSVDTNLILNSGTHRLTVQAVDAAGTFKATMNVNVASRPYPRFAYVANNNDQTLSTYLFEASTGFARQNGYVIAGAKPSGVAESKLGFAFATGGTDGKVYAYAKTYGGRLLPVTGSPFACGSDCRAVATDATGKFVYVADYTGNTISGFKVNSSTGALTAVAGSPWASGGQKPSAIAISGRGVLFATNEGSNKVASFTIDAVSGALTPAAGSPIVTGTGPQAVAVNPAGTRLYVANGSGNSISAYKVASGGVMTLLQTVAVSGPGKIAIYPSGAFLFVTQGAANKVAAFRLDNNGALHTIGVYATGPKPQAIATDVQGKYALVAHGGAPYELWIYKIDLTSGALTFVRSSRTHGQGTAIAVSSGSAAVAVSPGYLYAGTANKANYSGEVFGFAIAASGGLSTVAGSPFAHPRGVTAMAVHPMGSMLYAPGLKLQDEFSGVVAQYWVNRNTGVLTAAASYHDFEEFQSYSMVIDPSGRFAYAASGYGVTEPFENGWSVPASGGPLSNWLFYPKSPIWYTISIDPTGKYLFADGQPAAINPVTGDFDAPGENGVAGKLVVDPTGRFGWGLVGDEIRTYYVSGTTGALTQVGSGKPTGTGAAKIAVDPYGRFVYVANQNSNDVSGFVVNLGNGSLTTIGSTRFAAGTGPVDVTVDATGHYVYVVNSISLDVSAYTINQSTGALKSMTGSPFKLLAPGVATTVVTIPKVQ
jgi:6-phosphogluconolactonase (cycloisomerase 2 family)